MEAEVATSAQTGLHRLDPRLKVLLLLLIIVAIFSAQHFLPLVGLAVVVVGALCGYRQIVKPYKKHLYALRWLLLFTLLLHLFLTPGRTLFGLRIVSLDGLVRGVMVDMQLCLALFFTLALTLFTSSEAVAWATTRLLYPLRYLRLPIVEIGQLLQLVLFFLPKIYQQGMPLLQKGAVDKSTLLQRFKGFAARLGDALIALVDQADELALKIKTGELVMRNFEGVFRWGFTESLLLFWGVGLVFFCRSF